MMNTSGAPKKEKEEKTTFETSINTWTGSVQTQFLLYSRKYRMLRGGDPSDTSYLEKIGAPSDTSYLEKIGSVSTIKREAAALRLTHTRERP
jgi:hypothetical protein